VNVPDNLFEVVMARANADPALRLYSYLSDDAEKHLSAGELAAKALAVGGCLQKLGMTGKPVLLTCRPGLEAIVGFFGCIFAGAIAVPLPRPGRKGKNERVKLVLEDCGAGAVLGFGQDEIPALAELTSATRTPWLIVEDIADEHAKAWRKPRLDGSSLAFIQYTSGSTGAPKGVMVSHSNVLSNAAEMQDAFAINGADRGVSWLPFYHDMGLSSGMIQPVYSGYPSAIMSPLAFSEEPLRWLKAITSVRATLSGGPNFAYDLCVQKITQDLITELDLSSWRVAFSGSEMVRHETLEAFASRFKACGFDENALRPCYGLAEATLLVTARSSSIRSVIHVDSELLKQGKVEGAPEGSPRSKAVMAVGSAGARNPVAVVDPETRHLCAENKVGEIWITGASVAQGYWKKLKDTRKTFHARPRGARVGRYLRTGDLGFIRGEQLFITGRLKDLVIIRGQNFYPHDIEDTAAKSHPALSLGRSAAFSIDAAEGERLVIVQEVQRKAESSLDCEAIVRAVRESIAAEHQLHAHAVVLIRAGTLPRTTSGKVQRKACRDEFLSNSLKVIFSSVDAGDPVEAQPAALLPQEGPQPESALQCVLHVLAAATRTPLRAIHAQTPLSALGIDSLLAAQIRVAIERSTGVVVPVSRLLEGGSVLALAEFVEANRQAHGGPVKPEQAEFATRYPLSAGQKALWYLQQLEPENPAYTIARALRVRGPLNVETLRDAFAFLVERHPSLRTVILSDAGEPLQEVASRQAQVFDVIAAEEWDESKLQAQIAASARRPFDLQAGPLLRLQAYLRSGNEAVLLFVAHHIALDLWSLAQLMEELSAAYGSIRAGKAPELPPLGNRYADFVEWQSSMLAGRGRELSAYWLSRLEPRPPALGLPVSSQPSPGQPSATCHFEIEGGLSSRLAAIKDEHRVTLHALLLAAFEVLLHRYTGQPDFLLGVLSSGRNQACAENVVGYFVNPVLVRADLSSNPSFAEYVRQSYRDLLAALDHGDLPYSVLVEQLHANRNESRSPLIQAMCIFQPAKIGKVEGLTPFIMGQPGGAIAVDNLLFESMELSEEGTQFDLTLVACHGEERITAALKYDPARFDAEFIARLARHYRALLGSLAANPRAKVRELSLLTAAEEHEVTRAWNSTECAIRADASIHQLIQEQVDRTPDHDALIFEGVSLSYRELDAKANALTHYLKQCGVTAEAKVAVHLERSLEMVVSMLAILKAGAAYVPLDPSHPPERIQSILNAARPSLVVTTRHLAARVALPAGVRTICLDQDLALIAGCSTSRAESVAGPESLAYVMYTSGSTGVPKGVMIEHRNVVNFFRGMDEKVGCGPEDTLLAVTSIAFDISILELLWPLTRGARVVIVHDQALHSGTARRQARQPGKKVQFSLFYFASADSEGAGSHYEMLVEGAKMADQLGLAAVWTPERHFHAFGGMYPNPSLTNAALAMITSRVQLRAGSVVLPLHHPIRVAEEWALVDQLSRGRTGIAFASGWHADDFVFAPRDYAARKEIMYRGIETVQRLWRGDSVKAAGGAGNEIEVRIHPRPIQPELPVWITSSGSVETFESAARIRAHVLTHLLGQDILEVGEKIGVYRKGLAEQGEDPSSGIVTLMLHSYIDRDLNQVRSKALQPFKNYLRSSIGLIASLVQSLNLDLDLNNMEEDDLDDLLTFAAERYMSSSGLFGTPETCGNIVESARDVGANEIACLVDFGVDFASTMNSIRHIEELQHQFNSVSDLADYSLQAQAVRYGATMLQCTPSLMRMLLYGQGGETLLRMLRTLMLGGEAVPASVVQEVRKTYHGPVLNMYGPTETTIWSGVRPLSVEDARVFIGGAIANTQIYILDSELGPCPVGITGELYIGGNGLARGYLGDPALTAERFLPDPFAKVPGARLYRTGDLGRWHNDGRIDMAGRADDQVKVHGHRIELGDIEATLNKAPGVRTGVAMKAEASGEEELVAYLVPSNGDIDITAVRNFLRTHLPPYMVPGKMLVIDHLPLTPNRKIDRKSLLKIQVRQKPAAAQAALLPTGGLQAAILNIWKDVLKSASISIDDNFFDIGGHSLLMVQVHERLQRALQRTFPLITLLQYPTIRSLSGFLESSDALRAVPDLEKASQERNAMISQRNRAMALRAQ
jgi:natural product biosynthesis luciferase-like monooxygenase protein